MPKNPILKPKELITLLEKSGFRRRRQKGSHLLLVHEKTHQRVTVPIHNKDLKKGTLSAILRQSRLEF